jgi:hypothetical protein
MGEFLARQVILPGFPCPELSGNELEALLGRELAVDEGGDGE